MSLRIVYRHPTKPPRVRATSPAPTVQSPPFDPELDERIRQLALVEPTAIVVLRTFVVERLAMHAGGAR